MRAPRQTVAELQNRQLEFPLRPLRLLSVFAVKSDSFNRKGAKVLAKGAKVSAYRFPARRSWRNCASAVETDERRRMCMNPPLPSTNAHTSHATKSTAAAI